MDKTAKYFSKTNGKTDKKRTKKLEEMNKIFTDTMLAENYRGRGSIDLRPIERLVNDIKRQFVGEDEARAMRHARKVGKIKRGRK
tara:strand:- start:169 stop:423 length:255 start_codon:yes stop_codon:yes gene_type:complete